MYHCVVELLGFAIISDLSPILRTRAPTNIVYSIGNDI